MTTPFAWTAQKVLAALELPAAPWDHAYTGIGTDTRALRPGELFVALKGERFDGHDYLSEARLAEVGGAVVRRGTPRWTGFDWFEVEDTLEALGRLARHRRRQLAGPVIAVTGTNGKTSTRELIAAALAPRFRVHRSEGNLNNLVGVPLTLLAAPEETGAVVVECGASLVGEIARLRGIVEPTLAVVTNVGPGHLEGFGSVEAVLAEKVGLAQGVTTAVVGAEPPDLPAAARGAAQRVITAGGNGCDWMADEVRLDGEGRVRFRVRGSEVALMLRGRHMVSNALIALAVADNLGVALPDAAAALAEARIPGGRSEVTELDGVLVVNDTYNSNPASLVAALDLAQALRGERRLVVALGTMRELGPAAERLHREAAQRVVAAEPALIVGIGEFADAFRAVVPKRDQETRLITGSAPAAVAGQLRERLQPGDLLLLKASRGVQLERLIAILWPEATASEAH